MNIKLGDIVIDEVTGIKGVVTKKTSSRISEQIEVQPIVGSEEPICDSFIFDEARLKKVRSKTMTFVDFMCHSSFMAVTAGWLVLFGCMWYHDAWELSEVFAIKLGETIGLSILFAISVSWFVAKYRGMPK